MVVAIVDTGGHPRLPGEARPDTSRKRGNCHIEGEVFRHIQKADKNLSGTPGTRWRTACSLAQLKDAIPVEGGIPIIVDGNLIGALGISGGSSAEDEVCAEAGAAALSDER